MGGVEGDEVVICDVWAEEVLVERWGVWHKTKSATLGINEPRLTPHLS